MKKNCEWKNQSCRDKWYLETCYSSQSSQGDWCQIGVQNEEKCERRNWNAQVEFSCKRL